MSANGNKSFGPAPAVDNPPCPTAPSLTLERYNEIRVLAERVPRLLPPGSYYTLTENPHPTGENDKYKIAFMAREPGCPEDCQHVSYLPP